MKNKRATTYNVKRNVMFKNKFNNENYVGDLINEESIDGKMFFVVRHNSKVFKLAKDSYSVTQAR